MNGIQCDVNRYQLLILFSWQGVCTEAGMYALRERRVHVTQEDFELAVAKVTTSVLFCPSILY